MSDDHSHKKLNSPELKKSVFNVPEGYFSSIQEKIQAEIHVAESDLVKNKHLKKNIFTLPKGYFEAFKARVNARISPKETKVVPMYKTQWFKYAAAAIVLFGVLLFTLPKSTNVDKQLASISEDTIIEYLEEKQAIQYDLLSSVDGLSNVLDEMLLDETADYSFALGDNPELEYDIEYFDY